MALAISQGDMPQLTDGMAVAQGEGNNPAVEADSMASITVDQITELLNSPRRRGLLSAFAGHPETELEWSELVLLVTEHQYGEEWVEQERKRVQISLHQNHVPRMVEHGALTDREDEEGTRYVGEGPHFDVVARADEALNEAMTNEREEGGLLGRFF